MCEQEQTRTLELGKNKENRKGDESGYHKYW